MRATVAAGPGGRGGGDAGDELLRSRERTVKELEEHLRAAISTLSKRDATITRLESRLAAAQQETQNYRLRFAKVIQRAVTRQRGLPRGPPAKTKKPTRAPAHSRPKRRPRKQAAKPR
jgi:septal ring factor EnvC (AmiA/AmiB activator)